MNQRKIHITLEESDEIADIVQKIKVRREKKLNISVPNALAVLKQAVNLKILTKKTDALKKELTFLVNDAGLSRVLKRAGFAVVGQSQAAGVPKQASMLERKTAWTWVSDKLRAVRATKPTGKYPAIIRPNRKPVIAFGILALVFIVAIVYITLPTATIHIKPILKAKKSTLNIVMDTGAATRTVSGARDIRLRTASTTFERTLKLTPTGRLSTGGAARGKVTLINTGPNAFPIVGNTRLQTEEGLVFLTRNFVTVPGGSGAKPGTVTVEVVARDKDAKSSFTGSRGNIPPSTFFLPALSEGSRRIVYGKSFEPFTGGTDSFEYFVTKEDIAGATEKMRVELSAAAAEELKKTLPQDKTGAKMVIFERTEDMLKKTVDTIQVRAKENQKADEFEVYGKMSATGFAFDGSELTDILKANLLSSHMSPTEKILKIKEGSLTINEVLEKDAVKGRAKVNASIEAVISYDFLNNDLDLVQQIRSAVVGKSRSTAEKYLNSLKDVSKAWITVWPVWTPTLPTIPENIEIVIEEEG